MNRFWNLMGGNWFWGRVNRFDRRLSVVLSVLSAAFAVIAAIAGDWSKVALFGGLTGWWALMYVAGVWSSSDARLLDREIRHRRDEAGS